jgi:exodeoxyribonuclease-5
MPSAPELVAPAPPPQSSKKKEFKPNPQQETALAHIREWARDSDMGDFTAISGAAGTGKTTVMQEAAALFPGAVTWTAMTGKAALRMREAAGVQAKTLHSVLYAPPKDSQYELEFSKLAVPETPFVVVDEASMLTPKIFDDLHEWTSQGTRFLFVGDGYQLPPVIDKEEEKQYGKEFTIFAHVKGPFLSQVMRSDDDVIKVATQLREKRSVPRASFGKYEYRTVRNPTAAAIEAYLADPDDHIMVTWRNQVRIEANLEIRERKGIKTPYLQEGEPFLVCRNGQFALNGEMYTAAEITPGPTLGPIPTKWIKTTDGKKFLVTMKGQKAPMDGGMPYMPDRNDWMKYKAACKKHMIRDVLPITYGYVMTAHKAQGSEFRRVTTFLSSVDLTNPHFKAPTLLPDGTQIPFSTRWLYTSVTRAKTQISIYLDV